MLGNQNAVTLEGNNKLVDQKVPFADLDRSFTLRYSEVRDDEEVHELKVAEWSTMHVVSCLRRVVNHARRVLLASILIKEECQNAQHAEWTHLRTQTGVLCSTCAPPSPMKRERMHFT